MFLTVLIIVMFTCSSCETKNVVKGYCTLNVGTVLFREKDVFKDCWSSVDLSLLLTRYRSQQLVPNRRPTDMNTLLKYVTLWMKVVNEESSELGELEGSITKDAIADTLGGYLQAFALPLLRELLYEGNIDIRTALKLEKLHDGLKSKLSTNGKAWRKPITLKRPVSPIKPVRINCVKSMNYCKMLNLEKTENISNNSKNTDNCTFLSNISMPVLDNCNQPQAIAIPMKNMRLVNLRDSSSGPVLIKYLTNIVCCADSRNGTCLKEKSIFLKKYNNWLKRHILPRTNDEELIPAFQSTYGVMKTVDHLSRTTQKQLAQEESNKSNQTAQDGLDKGSKRGRYRRLLMALLLILLIIAVIWILICLCKICCKKIKVKRTSEMVEIKMSTTTTEDSTTADTETNTPESSSGSKKRRKKRRTKKQRTKPQSTTSNSKNENNYTANYMLEFDRSGLSDCDTTAHYGDDSESDLIE